MGKWWDHLKGSGVALGITALAAALLISALGSDRGLRGAWSTHREVVRAEQRNFELVQQIASLRSEILALREDDQTLEKVARRQAHLVRPGETLYRLPEVNP